jgi:branched-chain amino acid transport system permease protein
MINSDVFFQGLISGILMGSIYALVAAGFTMILGVMNLVNFAHGNFVMIGMYIAYFLGKTYNIDPFVSTGVVIPVMFAFGAIVYILIIRPILERPQYAQMMATLGLLIIIENVAILIFGGESRTLNTSYTTSTLALGAMRVSIARLYAAGGAVVILLGLYIFLYRTEMGRAVRACADEPESAQRAGINLNKVFITAFSIGTVLAGISGAIIMSFQVCSPAAGVDAVIKAFIIIVVGGLGSIPGAVAGGLIIGVTESVAAVLWSPSLANAIVFAILIIVISWRPAGIFSSRAE